MNTYPLNTRTAEKILARYDLGTLRSLKPIHSGLINPIFLLNSEYILRIDLQNMNNPDKLEREAFLFERLHSFDIPTPDLLGFDNTGNIIPHPYILISFIPGKSLLDSWGKLEPFEKKRVAFQLGDLAFKIHQLTPEKLGNQPVLGTMEQWLDRYVKKRQQYFQIVRQQHVFPKQIEEQITGIFNQFDKIEWSNKPRLKHGDFSPGNIQILNGEVVGIFDFEFSYIADPLRDLEKLPIKFQLPDLDIDEFLRGYQKTIFSAEEILRIKAHSLYQGLWELHAVINNLYNYGNNEFLEGKTLILNALNIINL